MTDYTPSSLTQPSGPPPGRRRRTGLIVALASGAVVLVLAGGVTAWLATRSSPAVVGQGPMTAATATLNPTAARACKELQAAGTDGQADPDRMREVAKVGSDALDSAIKADSDALFAAAESGAADDPAVQIRVMGASSDFMTDCYKGKYIKP